MHPKCVARGGESVRGHGWKPVVEPGGCIPYVEPGIRARPLSLAERAACPKPTGFIFTFRPSVFVGRTHYSLRAVPSRCLSSSFHFRPTHMTNSYGYITCAVGNIRSPLNARPPRSPVAHVLAPRFNQDFSLSIIYIQLAATTYLCIVIRKSYFMVRLIR